MLCRELLLRAVSAGRLVGLTRLHDREPGSVLSCSFRPAQLGRRSPRPLAAQWHRPRKWRQVLHSFPFIYQLQIPRRVPGFLQRLQMPPVEVSSGVTVSSRRAPRTLMGLTLLRSVPTEAPMVHLCRRELLRGLRPVLAARPVSVGTPEPLVSGPLTRPRAPCSGFMGDLSQLRSKYHGPLLPGISGF